MSSPSHSPSTPPSPPHLSLPSLLTSLQSHFNSSNSPEFSNPLKLFRDLPQDVEGLLSGAATGGSGTGTGTGGGWDRLTSAQLAAISGGFLIRPSFSVNSKSSSSSSSLSPSQEKKDQQQSNFISTLFTNLSLSPIYGERKMMRRAKKEFGRRREVLVGGGGGGDEGEGEWEKVGRMLRERGVEAAAPHLLHVINLPPSPSPTGQPVSLSKAKELLKSFSSAQLLCAHLDPDESYQGFDFERIEGGGREVKVQSRRIEIAREIWWDRVGEMVFRDGKGEGGEWEWEKELEKMLEERKRRRMGDGDGDGDGDGKMETTTTNLGKKENERFQPGRKMEEGGGGGGTTTATKGQPPCLVKVESPEPFPLAGNYQSTYTSNVNGLQAPHQGQDQDQEGSEQLADRSNPGDGDGSGDNEVESKTDTNDNDFLLTFGNTQSTTSITQSGFTRHSPMTVDRENDAGSNTQKMEIDPNPDSNPNPNPNPNSSDGTQSNRTSYYSSAETIKRDGSSSPNHGHSNPNSNPDSRPSVTGRFTPTTPRDVREQPIISITNNPQRKSQSVIPTHPSSQAQARGRTREIQRSSGINAFNNLISKSSSAFKTKNPQVFDLPLKSATVSIYRKENEKGNEEEGAKSTSNETGTNNDKKTKAPIQRLAIKSEKYLWFHVNETTDQVWVTDDDGGDDEDQEAEGTVHLDIVGIGNKNPFSSSYSTSKGKQKMNDNTTHLEVEDGVKRLEFIVASNNNVRLVLHATGGKIQGRRINSSNQSHQIVLYLVLNTNHPSGSIDDNLKRLGLQMNKWVSQKKLIMDLPQNLAEIQQNINIFGHATINPTPTPNQTPTASTSESYTKGKNNSVSVPFPAFNSGPPPSAPTAPRAHIQNAAKFGNSQRSYERPDFSSFSSSSRRQSIPFDSGNPTPTTPRTFRSTNGSFSIDSGSSRRNSFATGQSSCWSSSKRSSLAFDRKDSMTTIAQTDDLERDRDRDFFRRRDSYPEPDIRHPAWLDRGGPPRRRSRSPPPRDRSQWDTPKERDALAKGRKRSAPIELSEDEDDNGGKKMKIGQDADRTPTSNIPNPEPPYHRTKPEHFRRTRLLDVLPQSRSDREHIPIEWDIRYLERQIEFIRALDVQAKGLPRCDFTEEEREVLRWNPERSRTKLHETGGKQWLPEPPWWSSRQGLTRYPDEYLTVSRWLSQDHGMTWPRLRWMLEQSGPFEEYLKLFIRVFELKDKLGMVDDPIRRSSKVEDCWGTLRDRLESRFHRKGNVDPVESMTELVSLLHGNLSYRRSFFAHGDDRLRALPRPSSKTAELAPFLRSRLEDSAKLTEGFQTRRVSDTKIDREHLELLVSLLGKPATARLEMAYNRLDKLYPTATDPSKRKVKI